MKSFPNFRTSTLADSVEKTLIEYIKEEKLSPGDPLPKEEELAAGMNVSRNIVREGISRLKTLGLVESRRRRGRVVASPNPFEGLDKQMRANLFSDAERKEWMGLRVILELGMADDIYARKTPGQIAELRRLAETNGPAYAREQEIAFHSALFVIGGNSLAVRFRDILSSAFRDVPASSEIRDVPGHIDLCDALENGSCSEFRAVLKQHFRPYESSAMPLDQKTVTEKMK